MKTINLSNLEKFINNTYIMTRLIETLRKLNIKYSSFNLLKII